VLLAAAPAWFADNAGAIVVIKLLVLAAGVLWLVPAATMRLILLGLIAAVALFTFVNRGALETCARTCECRIADTDIDVPGCTPDR
jgi:cobalamin biosynthesis protein CobD/CbiB